MFYINMLEIKSSFFFFFSVGQIPVPFDQEVMLSLKNCLSIWRTDKLEIVALLIYISSRNIMKDTGLDLAKHPIKWQFSK